MVKKFLKFAYGLEDSNATRDYYRDWSASYDDEITENGYATPRRCAEALARHAPNKNGKLLDIGCGTGLSGITFREAGFQNIDGNDLSAEMLAIAKERGIYNHLIEIDLSKPDEDDNQHYNYIAAVGVISTGHAPPRTISDMFEKLPVDGLFVFSLNDPTLQDGSSHIVVEALVASGKATLLEETYGTHLPKIGMKSTVYVLQKKASQKKAS